MLNIFIAFSASFLIWILFAGLLFLWLIDGRIKKEQALHAFFSAIAAWILADMIKGLFPTLRPFYINGLVPLTVTTPQDGSFPSGHSAAAFALAVSLWLHDKKIGFWYLLVALIIGVARVLAHVHFLVDILGGAVLGSSVAFLVDKLHLYSLIRKSGS